MNTKDKFVKILLFFGGVYLFSPFSFVFANLEINEIMYDLKTGSDEGREWVEILNNSATDIDMTSFKFFEEDTEHRLKLVQGSGKIKAQSYALIVSDLTKFKDNNPYFFGTIFDSSFSLHNSGENLAIKDGAKVVDEYFYRSSSGGAGDGKSLQKINGTWMGAVPTPGLRNKISPTSPSTPGSSTVPNKTPAKESSSSPTPVSQQESPIDSSSADGKEKSNNSLIFFIIFIFLLGVCGGAVYFIRKNKKNVSSGDDFEILDK